MSNLATNIQVMLRGDLATSRLGTLTPKLEKALALVNGTAAGQADLFVAEDLSITTTPTVFNLSDGSLLTPELKPAAMVEVVAMAFIIDSAGELRIGAGTGAFNPWINGAGAYLKLPGNPGIFLLASTGDPAYPVVASTGDKLQLVADTGTITGAMAIAGRSA